MEESFFLYIYIFGLFTTVSHLILFARHSEFELLLCPQEHNNVHTFFFLYICQTLLGESFPVTR